MVSAVLSAHAYIFLVVVCAAFLVAIGWTIHSLFYRDQFTDPAPMRAPQISYLRDVRQRERQQLLASNDNTAGRDEENFHDQFIEDCAYPDLMARDATHAFCSNERVQGSQHCFGRFMETCADCRPLFCTQEILLSTFRVLKGVRLSGKCLCSRTHVWKT
jgi:hypothetical protein